MLMIYNEYRKCRVSYHCFGERVKYDFHVSDLDDALENVSGINQNVVHWQCPCASGHTPVRIHQS